MLTTLMQAEQITPTTTDGGGFGGLEMLIPFGLILVVMYFIMIRPQKKQQKERMAMLSQMKKNDRVVTIGGIAGVIYQIDEDEVVLKVDERNDIRMTVSRWAIREVVNDETSTAG